MVGKLSKGRQYLKIFLHILKWPRKKQKRKKQQRKKRPRKRKKRDKYFFFSPRTSGGVLFLLKIYKKTIDKIS